MSWYINYVMKLYSLKSYISEHADFFCWNNPYFDMRFLLNKTLYYEVVLGEYGYTIYTPNMMFANINIDKRVTSFEEIEDVNIRKAFMDLASLAYSKFQICNIPNYMHEPISFFKDLKIGINLIPVKKLTNEQIKDEITVKRESSGENYWAMDLLCSIIPSNIESTYSHRLLFKLTHPKYGIIDFNLNTLDLNADTSSLDIPTDDSFTFHF